MNRPAIDLHLDLDIDQPFEVVSCRIAEGLSEPTHAHLEIGSTENLELDRVLTDSAVITLLRDGAPARTWTLRVGRIEFARVEADSLRFAVDLYAHPWLLRLTENTRKFRHLSARDIVSQVLTECGVAHAWQLVREPARRNYCVQYHESNLDFVSRLLEFEGIYYTFDDDGVMVLGDRSSAGPMVPGRAHFELLGAAQALAHGEEGIVEFHRGSRAASGAATVHDYNWKTPQVDLRAGQTAERDRYLEIYDYPAGFRQRAEGERLAQLRLEALRVPARYVGGRGTVHGFAPGRLFHFGADAGPAFAGEYLLTQVEHDYRNPAYDKTTALGAQPTIYANRFGAIPRAVPFRPRLRTARPTIAGYHTAMVRGPAGEEIHTDDMGRFKAQFHWDREATGTDVDSRWLRVAQESASSLFLARVGWEMNVAYIDGDPDRPIGLARNINGVMVPAYSQPASKNVMTIKTPTSPATGGYNELKLDDTAGSMLVELRAERDLVNIVLNDRSESIGHSEIRDVGASVQETIERDQRLTVGADLTVSCGGEYALAVDNDRTVSIGGNEQVEIGESDGVSIAGADAETVGSVRLSITGSISPPKPKALLQSQLPEPNAAAQSVGRGALAGARSGGLGGAVAGAKSSLASMVPAPPSVPTSLGALTSMLCQGSVNRSGSTKLVRMVGGAYVDAALGAIDASSAYGLAEVVGGVKLTVAARGSVSQSVMGPLATTVGGVVMRQSKGNTSYSSPTASVRVGGIAQLSSDEKLDLRSDGTIELTAATSLELTTGPGGLSLTLAPSSAKLTGNLKLEAADKIAITGKPDNVTKP